MITTTLRRAALLTAALLAICGAAAPAEAAPDNSNTFALDLACADGSSYTITLLATTPDQPAVHVVGTTAVLVPVAFQWHTLITDADADVLDETTSPVELVHGASAYRLTTVRCTFSQVAHHDWPGIGPVTIVVDGTVWAHRPG